jgi:predicted  nucleic acid-binding Zn-ribbon protein
VAKGFRVKRWYETPHAAKCKACGARWDSVFEVFMLDACPECGHREKQSAAYYAAFPDRAPADGEGERDG